MTNATAISRSRVWSVLTTPAAIPQTGPRLKTNLDTDLLKLIAIAAMLIDHIGGAFFPEVGVFRWIGRLAFPIFCYCMTVGLLYTRDIKRYLGRLGLFALILGRHGVLDDQLSVVRGGAQIRNGGVVYFIAFPRA